MWETQEFPLKNDALIVPTKAMIHVFVKSVKENGEDTALPHQTRTV